MRIVPTMIAITTTTMAAPGGDQIHPVRLILMRHSSLFLAGAGESTTTLIARHPAD